MIDPNDKEYREFPIEDVNKVGEDGWEIVTDGGWIFWVQAKHDEPKVGQIARFYGEGIGSPVRGLAINNKILFYNTPAEQDEEHKRWLKDSHRKQREEFEANKDKLDAQYEALPPIFQKRIDKFRRNNPDFRWEFEGYEMFTCTEAVKIAETLKTDEKIREWIQLPWEEQNAIVDIDSDHSGNTFGMAGSLARMYVTNESYVEKAHGSLSVLVGSEAYGDIPK